MKRKDDFVATVSKTGFKTVQASVGHKVATNGGAAFLGNALIGGVLGAGVDVYSGAALDLKPNPLSVTLVPDDAAVSMAAPAGAVVESVAPAGPAPAQKQ
jgi:hypothetical protein